MKINNLLRKNSRLVHLTLMTVLALGITNVSCGGASKDCYTCNPDYVPGNPVQGNQTLGQLTQISVALLSDADSTFMGNLYGFCMSFPGGVYGARDLKKKITSKLETKLINGKIDLYFLEAGCNPDNLGGARSPIAHIAAEIPSDRIEHLEVLRKYFIEKKKDELFTKMLNAKNTQGHTTLDYLNYLLINKKFTETQVEASGNFIKYLCSHGAVYSTYKNKSCSDLQVANK